MEAKLEINDFFFQKEEYISQRALYRLKLGIWIYFFLLIFEGALRKWILPGLAEPLLIIRDPFAAWLIFYSFKTGFWKPNGFVLIVVAATILAFVLALFVGHGDLVIALYGFRTNAIHFPLIFIIGSVFNRDDVLNLGRAVLWISIGMTFLVAIQFYSPQTAWVNRGLGGDMEGSGFQGAAGYFRVPGTFSFTTGLSFFYSLTIAYIFYFWISNKKEINRMLLIVSTLALVAAVPMSVSRTVVFQIAVTMVFIMVLMIRDPGVFSKVAKLAVGAIIFVVIMSSFKFFQTATFVLQERFFNANESEGGFEGVFIDRFLGGMYEALTEDSFEFWGAGLGMGTNVGARLLTGDRTFLVAEDEWGRLIGEMGFVLGLIVIAVRAGVVISLLQKAWRSISEENLLPWMLMSFGIFIILQGQWAQPTTLGFGVLIGGLTVASLRKN